MPSNAAPIVQQIQGEFHALIAYVTGPEAQTQSAYTVELTLFRRLLAIGAALLRLFFVAQTAERPPAPTAADGTVWAYYDQRSISYYSIFGKLRVARHYFTAPGHAGTCPLDAALSLPDHCYSDLLSDWASYGSTDAAYRENQTALERILGLTLSVQALETMAARAAADVSAFYHQPPAPATPLALGSILVVQADGKGVPLVQPPLTDPPLRLGKGQKRTKKKEAIVTCLYTIAPYVRTAQDVQAALLHQERRADHPTRPVPVHKETRATLDGKAAALRTLQQRAVQRDALHIRARVALTDGAEESPAADDHGVSRAYPDLGHYPRQRISVGHRYCCAGGNQSAPHALGSAQARSAVDRAGGRADRPTHDRDDQYGVDGNAAHRD